MTIFEAQTKEERLALIEETAKAFKERAYKHDIEGTFPYENYEDLKAIRYPAATVPKKYGGLEISLVEMLKAQEIIASYDGSTGLSIGWHMGITKNIAELNVWEKEKYASYAKEVVEKNVLLNSAATELATGSPTRGNRPQTYAVEREDGWVLNGRKAFTTLSPILDYFAVTASIEGTDEVGNFLVPRHTPGLEVVETWDSVGMQATGSHDIVLKDVQVAKDDLLHYLTPGDKGAQGWLLHIPACYLGIAKGAMREAFQFATTYSPANIEGTISDIPTVKHKIGEIELLLLEMESILYRVARKWDESDDAVRQTMKAELGAVKVSVVNKANKVVDLAMRIVGARSLSAKNPLQRYYRDVRAGLHNPPMDDMTLVVLADQSITQFKERPQ